jgi:hypothetical protein
VLKSFRIKMCNITTILIILYPEILTTSLK